MQKQKLKFPKGFLWGSSMSSYQTEGGNSNTDWWVWERSLMREDYLRSRGKNPEDFYSGIATDSYNRYDEDFSLAQHLNQNAIRFSIEWARIQPEEGEFSEKEIYHYEKVLQSAKAHGLTTFVTLHHFSSPLWFMRRGGFTKKENTKYFVAYAKKIAQRLGQYADFWITINEPEIYSTHGYLLGKYPPQQRNVITTLQVANNLILAHNQTYDMLHSISNIPVSMANQLPDIQTVGILSRPVTAAARYLATRYILSRTIKQSDFIGVNYYIRQNVGWFGLRAKKYEKYGVSDLGWELYPSGLEHVLLSLKEYNKPIYVTENGLADAKDVNREKFIKDHLYHVHRAIEQGADVRGYLHWSLIDNFEWTDGFAPRFGLIEIDRNDLLRRKARYSAVQFAEICKNNYMEY